MKKVTLFLLTLFLATTFLSACVTPLQYDKITLGMSKDEVRNITGRPSRVQEGEATSEVFSKSGKYEIWFYEGGVFVFSEDRLITKLRNVWR